MKLFIIASFTVIISYISNLLEFFFDNAHEPYYTGTFEQNQC